MKTALYLTGCYDNAETLRRVFSWLTKCGAGRKFGSLPIGWYQQHQRACIDILLKLVGGSAIRSKIGHIQAKRNGKWTTVISAIELFQQADNSVRSSK